jgi:choloylglycine hydrolase
MNKQRFRARLAARIAAAVVALSTLAVATTPAHACTGIVLTARDGAFVRARTLEFAVDPQAQIIVVPRGFVRRGTTPDGANGLTWRVKYASIGANALGLPDLIDGLNEKGLSVGLFYFPGVARFMPYRPADADRTIAAYELGSWLLDNFASVKEIKQRLADVAVAATPLPAWGFAPPVHYAATDASGESIVIEYVEGKLHVYDNPLGVVTNSPDFEWHKTNLGNYMNLTPVNASRKRVAGVDLGPPSQGSGARGLPGDFTSPSRFVRAAFFVHSAPKADTSRAAVLQAFHTLNSFDIPKGSVSERAQREGEPPALEYTMWTTAADLKTLQYFFRTYDNSRVRMVDLSKMDLDAKSIVGFSMKGGEDIEVLPAGSATVEPIAGAAVTR